MTNLQAAAKFSLDGKPLVCVRFGNGHINETYLLQCGNGADYVLQKINGKIFTDVAGLMKNITLVTDHLKKEDPRNTLTLVKTKDGASYLSEDGEFWRVYEFVKNSASFDKAESASDFYESGAAFGRFNRSLENFDASALVETIPNFHNTPLRYETFKKALSDDKARRLGKVKEEIEFALSREPYAATLINAGLPLRVSHNDTKLNNVLFDRTTRKAICAADLDTVMPGLSVTDFGDAIRYGASTAAEDERDLSKVTLSFEMFEAFAKGFTENCAMSAKEAEYLCDGAKMMTLECGVRFLTDYLNGDVYFKISRPGQNLDRCRTQFKLLREMERDEHKMREIVKKITKEVL